MPEQRKCKACGALVVWCRTVSGNLIPLDADACCDGDMALIDDMAINRAVLGASLGQIYDGFFYLQHVSVCPVIHPRPKEKRA